MCAAWLNRLFFVRLSLSKPLSGLMAVVPPADQKIVVSRNCDTKGLRQKSTRETIESFHEISKCYHGLRVCGKSPAWHEAHLDLKRNSPDLGSDSSWAKLTVDWTNSIMARTESRIADFSIFCHLSVQPAVESSATKFGVLNGPRCISFRALNFNWHVITFDLGRTVFVKDIGI
jgi:hypothetical protein